MSKEPKAVTSRIPGFYKQRISDRLQRLIDTGLLSDESTTHLQQGGRLELEVADHMSENVIAVHGLPLSVALNFRVNNRDVLVPMIVEEPSVVAAASNAARLVRMTGGFVGEATRPIMTTQVQLDAVPEPHEAGRKIEAARELIFKVDDEAIPGMVKRGGGCRDLDVRVLDADEGLIVVHLYVDVGESLLDGLQILLRTLRKQRDCSDVVEIAVASHGLSPGVTSDDGRTVACPQHS